MPLHPEDTYVCLADDGAALEMAANSFCQLPAAELARYGARWLVSEFTFTETELGSGLTLEQSWGQV